ncbi:MAG: amidohydrolase [Planctomycetota bacterium]|nr:MAG: amidohydrolase [Planctomycetota bacterium]
MNSPNSTSQQPNLLIQNTTIHTPEFTLPPSTSLLIQKGKISAIYHSKPPSKIRKHTQPLQAPKGCLIPGFIDCHLHLAAYARSLKEVHIPPQSSKAKILSLVQQKTKKLPPNQWIFGRGWNKNHWPDPNFPTAQELDQVAPHHPVAIASRDAHCLWLNTLALQTLHITSQTPDPPGGKILRNHKNQPTGILLENAIQLLPPQTSLSPSELNSTLEHLHSLGITGVHTIEDGHTFSLLQQLQNKNKLHARVRFSLPASCLNSLQNCGMQSPFGNEQIRFCGIKLFADGTLGSQSAYMLEPYDNSNQQGMEILQLNELLPTITQAAKSHIQVLVHCIGDGAVQNTIQAFQKALSLHPTPTLQHRLEHCQHLPPKLLPHIAQLNLIASMQPCHLINDAPTIQKLLSKRQKYAYPFASLLNTGAHLAFGSDAPIESPHPLRGLQAAIERDNFLEGQENLTPRQALIAYTSQAATSFGEHDVGKIQLGCRADLVLFEEDILHLPPQELPKLHPLTVIVDGKILHPLKT